jgi:hypothetical protein
LVGKPEGKRLLARPRRRWGDDMRIDLREIVKSCGPAQEREQWRTVNAVMKYRVP